ncbi:hypothetical protein jhhlp_002197 [Lomentospora prolificans]|uniref:Uncharacterized protein n=1 Tax=Lomentospora prolificans TaxID=41688 RepID=A0A2N3NDA6_9PEZI|nr:hypothetical protein jhhlp_002197 [Lomentospora prolificans]
MGWFDSKPGRGPSSSSRKKKPAQKPQRLQCGWTNNGWTCRYARASVLINNVRVACQFCRFHQCRKNGQVPCSIPTAGGFPFCQDHTRCTVTGGNGARCTNYVKSMNANKYKYCAQLHSCSKDDCDSRRVIEDDVDLKYCADHRCTASNCKKEKGPTAIFCPSHTCEGPSCTAYAEGGGNPGSWTRYCDRHRVCMNKDCNRLCHIHEDGIAAKYCGLHYCKVSGCDNVRHGDQNCEAHSCIEVGCQKGRHEVESVYCKSHECKTSGCRFKRRRGDWCPEHACSKPNCDRGAQQNGYCERHQLCTVPGCERYRSMEGEKTLERCDHHAAVVCTFAGCDRRAVRSRAYCPTHLCTIRECANSITNPPSALCNVHKCSLPHCIAAKWAIPAHPTMTPGYAMLVAAPSPYCVQHACNYPSCVERAEPETQRCRDHTRCRRDGCARFADRTRASPYCLEHRPTPNYLLRRPSPELWDRAERDPHYRECARYYEDQRADRKRGCLRRDNDDRRHHGQATTNVEFHIPRCI